jgi:hypothetical protein
MGRYIQTEGNKNKAEEIAATYEGTIVSQYGATKAINDPIMAVIVVVDNGPFEAAAYAYSQAEFEAFIQPTDKRPKKFVIIDRKIAEEIAK